MGGCMKPTDKQKNTTEELKKKGSDTTIDQLSVERVERGRSLSHPIPDKPYFNVDHNDYQCEAIKNNLLHNHSKPLSQKAGSICPLKHPATHTKIVYKQLSTCNKCHTRYNYKQNIKSFSLFYRCTDCKYQVCSKCVPLKHGDVCTSPSLSYCKTNKYKIVGYSKAGNMFKCCFCSKKINNFVHCDTCKAGACGSCMNLKKDLICQHKFQFKQKDNMMCIYCQKFGHALIECSKCQIQMCSTCYTEVYLKS